MRLAASAPEMTSVTSPSNAPKLRKSAVITAEAPANIRSSTIHGETTVPSIIGPVVKEEFTEEDDNTLLTKVLEHEHGGGRPNLKFFQGLAEKVRYPVLSPDRQL